jgi:hypothetical protein
MKKFLELYEAPISATDQMVKATPEQAKAGMDAWMSWSKKNSKAIADLGMSLSKGKRVQPGSVGDGQSTVVGYSILQGDSLESITKILRDHPHLHTPGGSIEVFEFLQVPGM